MPLFREMAAGKEILELGVRLGRSTRAWLAGRPKLLVSVDLDLSQLDPQVEAAAKFSGIEFWLIKGDSSNIPPTAAFPEWVTPRFDILFIDTYHNAQTIRAELQAHAWRARENILIHDTAPEINWHKGEDGGPGIGGPIEELLAAGQWRIKEHRLNNCGMMILERVNNGGGLG
jgi:hypothetical protein